VNGQGRAVSVMDSVRTRQGRLLDKLLYGIQRSWTGQYKMKVFLFLLSVYLRQPFAVLGRGVKGIIIIRLNSGRCGVSACCDRPWGSRHLYRVLSDGVVPAPDSGLGGWLGYLGGGWQRVTDIPMV
jgi:hypothetical protein